MKARSKSVFAFNIAEYLDEENKTVFLPALLDEWEIPHLGSSAQVINIGLDKARTMDGRRSIRTYVTQNLGRICWFFGKNHYENYIEIKSFTIQPALWVLPGFGKVNHLSYGDSQDAHQLDS